MSAQAAVTSELLEFVWLFCNIVNLYMRNGAVRRRHLPSPLGDYCPQPPWRRAWIGATTFNYNVVQGMVVSSLLEFRPSLAQQPRVRDIYLHRQRQPNSAWYSRRAQPLGATIAVARSHCDVRFVSFLSVYQSREKGDACRNREGRAMLAGVRLSLHLHHAASGDGTTVMFVSSPASDEHRAGWGSSTPQGEL
jgi:hypothetical protein